MVNGTPPTVERVKPTTSFSATEQQAGSPSTSASPSYKGLGGSGGRNCVVKVVKADKNLTQNGKIEFKSIDQMFIDLVPSNANIDYIQAEVQAKWGCGIRGGI